MMLDRAARPLPPVQMLVAGLVSALGFAPVHLWPLTFLGLAALIDQVQRASRTREALLAGGCFGFGHFVLSLNWIAMAFTHQSTMPVWLGGLAVVLLSAYLALFAALAAGLAWRLSRRRPLALVLLFAASWMLGEWLRSVLFGGFAWNPLAVLWLDLPAIGEGDAWVGPFAMSGLLVLIAGLLWLGLCRRPLATAALGVALVALGTGLRAAAPAHPPAHGLPVRIVQPNISQDEQDDEADANIARYLRLSGRPGAAPRLLLWSEGATLGFLDEDPAERARIARVLGPHDLLLTGGASVAALDLHGSDDQLYNSVFALDPAGKVLWRYAKAHLVPFGEFLPARPILSRLGLTRLVQGEDGGWIPGPGPRTFGLPGFVSEGQPITVAVQVCYEIVFPGRVIDERHRPSFLFNPSDDAWFGAWGPPQHLAQARLRAIEEGVPVIRATPNGISAVISPTGQVLARLPRHAAGVIDAHVPQALPPTLFARLGERATALVGLLLGAAGIVATLTGARAAARAPVPERAPFRPLPGAGPVARRSEADPSA